MIDNPMFRHKSKSQPLPKAFTAGDPRVGDAMKRMKTKLDELKQLIQACEEAVTASERMADLSGPVHRIKVALEKWKAKPGTQT